MRLARFGFASFALASLVGLGATAGCSSPVPPTPKGAWSLTFLSGADTSACQVNKHNASVGGIDKSERGDEVTDGVDGASVSCTVSGSGTFSVKGSASFTGKSLALSIGAIDNSATADKPAKGSVSFSSPTTAGNPYVNPTESPCAFWFEKGTGEKVDTGKIWVAFACEAVRDDGHDSTCAITSGYAIFENCSDGVTEE